MIKHREKIYIATVGGQELPVVQGILEFEPDFVYLICSEQSETNANSIAEKLRLTEGWLSIVLHNPNDYFEILTTLRLNFMSIVANQMVVNIAGGTKIMTLALFSYFSSSPHNAFVFHIDQNGQIHNLLKPEVRKLEKTMSICDYLEFSGQRVKSMIPASDIDDDLLDLASRAKNLYHKGGWVFGELMSFYRKNEREFQHGESFRLETKNSKAFLSWTKEEGLLQIELLNSRTGRFESYEFEGAASLEIVLNTKWFELEVYKLIRQWKRVREIGWSLVVPYQAGYDKNEFDLVVNVGTKLVFVECKTKVAEMKDLDKFGSVSKRYGGIGAKTLLVCWNYPEPRVIEKCRDNSINWFSLFDQNRNRRELQAFFQMLDAIVDQSNTI